jgi:hypothetical protein
MHGHVNEKITRFIMVQQSPSSLMLDEILRDSYESVESIEILGRETWGKEVTWKTLV